MKLLHSLSDREAAERLGVPVTTVIGKRRRIGLRRKAPILSRHRWTREDEALLVRHADRDVAERLGLTADAVKQKRRSLGILRSKPRIA